MIDIFLHLYDAQNDVMALGYAAPHRYRSNIFKKLGEQENLVRAWNRQKELICKKLINRMLEIYSVEESFLLFTPATKTKLFVNDLIEAIKSHFPNIVDLTYVFTKKSDFSLGDEQYRNISIEQVETLIKVNTNKINRLKRVMSKAFVIDDVYSSGKSMDVTRLLILKYAESVTEIKNGVILKTM